MTRQLRGTTARSRGQIVRKGDNKYLVRAYLGRDAAGTRRYASRTVAGTFRQAEQALTKLLREVDTKSFVEPSRQTLGEYLRKWLDSKHDITERTRLDYRTRLEKDVLPRLGSVRLSQLMPLQVQGLYAELVSHRLSARTVRYTHSILKQALETAVRFELLAKNPARYVTLPRQERREMQVLTPEQVRTLLDSAALDPLYPLWALLLTTGLRPQEALAVRWEDLDGPRLRIQRTLVKVARDRYELRAETKTASSRRSLQLPESVLRALAGHRSRQAAEALQAGARYARQGLIFANSVGNPLDISKVRTRWKVALKRAALPPVRLYDTRHTHITHLLSEGVNVKAVAARVGHANANMTLSVYAHVLPEVDVQSAAIVERLLRGPQPMPKAAEG